MPFPHLSPAQIPAERPQDFRGVGALLRAELMGHWAHRNPHWEVDQGYTPPISTNLSATQREGLKYEEAVVNKLLVPSAQEDPDVSLLVQPSFCFLEDGRPERRVCRPDAVIVAGHRLYIFEVKLTRTPRAWYQLFELYGPVVTRALGFDPRMTSMVEVFRDQAQQFEVPSDTHQVETLENFESCPCGWVLNLLQWSPANA